MRYAAVTDLGLVRKNNEDSIFAQNTPVGPLNNLFLVADGMGGHQGGEYASSFVVYKIPELLAKKKKMLRMKSLLVDAADRANRELYRISQTDEELKGMGTTLVLATVAGELLHVLNVGDSRLYHYHEGELLQVTRDHSLVEEMVAEGRLERSDPFYAANRNVITRAMGIEELVEEDYFVLELFPDSRILMCSDGLSGMLSDEMISRILKEEPDTDRAVSRLVEESKNQGGSDNISVILLDMEQAFGNDPENEVKND